MAGKIVLTGGGTAGHVTPNFALLPALSSEGYEVFYIGSKDGLEKKLVEDYNIPYYGVSVGKLRRYFSWKNFTDPFRIINGYFEAKAALKMLKPDVVFSKGGFVSVPVVRAAHRLHIPCIIHESDMTPGLANKLCIGAARYVCCNFPETTEYIRGKKGIHTGTPIRAELLTGSKEAGLAFCGFSADKPVVLVIGGSQGARAINITIREALPKLTKKFNIIHLCGKGNLDETLTGYAGYVQYEYIKDELKDLFAAADIAVSRAGANAIFELLALHKPNLLIPLPTKGSRGDQLLNANSFKASGYSDVLLEEDMTSATLMDKLDSLYLSSDKYIKTMETKQKEADPISTIINLINEVSR